MLAGSRAFHRDSAVETMNAILKADPPKLLPQRADIPAGIERIVRRCLEKQAERRFRSASDLGFALETVSTASASISAINVDHGLRRFNGMFAIVAALAAFMVGRQTTTAPNAPVWNGSLLVGGSTIAIGPRVSPDGRTVAFLVMVDGLSQVAVLQLNSGDWEIRTFNRSGPIQALAWSGDSSKIFF